MIRVAITQANGEVSKIVVSGHAGFEGPDGGDIVCSAVSALVGFLGITFTEILPTSATLSADDGEFQLMVHSGEVNQPGRVVLEGWKRSILQLEENYSGWVKVEVHQ